MKNPEVILMADIVASRSKNQKQLMSEFQDLSANINASKSELLLSPITITLGDEFQCVAKDVESGIVLMIALDEEIIRQQSSFKFRYVLLQGQIETEINPAIAYGMLGDGLTRAREKLNSLKGSGSRYTIDLEDQKASSALADLFVVYQKMMDSWKRDKDYPLVAAFLENEDYKVVAESLERDRALMWRREKSLWIKEYLAIKNVIKFVAQNQ